MLLPFAILTGFCVGTFFVAVAVPGHGAETFIVGACLGATLAWPLSRLPLYYHRRKFDESFVEKYTPSAIDLRLN